MLPKYKKLMLPQGERLWDEYLNEIEFDHYDPSSLPPKNIYLMSISEFEYFLASKNMHNSLNEITEKEKDFKTRSMFLKDYLSKKNLIDSEKISFIKKKFDECFESLLKKSFSEELIQSKLDHIE